ncbi:MAG: phosphate ABC transporter substrate-binding protein PstS [Candidatus Cloacimonetes bacterium]|nr:phosphate ABC transporter substrate-binding protein PstS [Candidatus Cloacimonadota bacterium]
MNKINMCLLSICLLLSACVNSDKSVQGAGATLPEALYRKMFSEYTKKTGEKIHYVAIGSGGGIYKLMEKSVDFAASDMISEKEEWNREVFYLPVCLGGVAIAYNLPANPVLDLTPDILSMIFQGEIIYWNDQRIKDINKDIILPNQRILVISRSDDSGTTRIFADYLSKVNSEWATREKNPLKEFFALSAGSNSDVANLIAETPGSVGFICLHYAVANKLAYARIQNSTGNFILPDPSSIALASNTEIPADTQVYLTNSNSEYGYPVSGFSWIILYRDLSYLGSEKAERLIRLLNWMLTDGQEINESLLYSRLPSDIAVKAQNMLNDITY